MTSEKHPYPVGAGVPLAERAEVARQHEEEAVQAWIDEHGEDQECHWYEQPENDGLPWEGPNVPEYVQCECAGCVEYRKLEAELQRGRA